MADLVSPDQPLRGRGHRPPDRGGHAPAAGHRRRDGPENPDFVIRHLEDSGAVPRRLRRHPAAASGEAGAYDWERPGRRPGPARRRPRLRGALPRPTPPAGSRCSTAVRSRSRLNVAAGFGENGRPAETGDGSRRPGDRRPAGPQPVMVGSLAHLRRPLRRRRRPASASRASGPERRRRDPVAASCKNLPRPPAVHLRRQHGRGACQHDQVPARLRGRRASSCPTSDEMLDTIINRMGV
ncbi:MAG: hypothetical protein M0C28_41550 [Candidatus Moduliflexus flocculans]|nr:hypothetical protein [Candidatus Moduliflexus flocculans]